LSFSVTLTSQVGADFANEINAIFGAGTAVYSAPNLQLTAPIDVFGSTANISIVTDPVNYVGE